MPIKKKYLYAAGGFFVTTWLLQLAMSETFGSGAQSLAVQALITPDSSPV